MLGTNDRTLQVVNGEQNSKNLLGVLFRRAAMYGWRMPNYGVALNASNKPSEHNIMQMPSYGIRSLPLINMPQYNLQTKRILSSNIVLPGR